MNFLDYLDEISKYISLKLRRHRADPPLCRPAPGVYAESARTPAPPSEVDIYGEGSRAADHLKWALQKASCWQYEREFTPAAEFIRINKIIDCYTNSAGNWTPQLREK